MKYIFLAFILILPTAIFAQNAETADRKLQKELDSIVAEGSLLYKYEKATWVATDFVHEDSKVKKKIGGYLTYQIDGHTFKTIILNKSNKVCIAEYTFTNDFDTPDYCALQERALRPDEKSLLEIKNKLVKQLDKLNYEVSIPEGYRLNLILIPLEEGEDGYNLYVLTGTSIPNVIPFGNDYLFKANSKGEIMSWQKFHSSLVPSYTVGANGEKVTMVIHSHLKTNPMMTATDICTFMLYGPLYGQEDFSVYSPALNKYIRYNLKRNKIFISD